MSVKAGYLVVSWMSGEYLQSLGGWVKESDDGHFFRDLEQAINAAECHSYFSCSHLEVVYADRSRDLLQTVYRTETKRIRTESRRNHQ